MSGVWLLSVDEFVIFVMEIQQENTANEFEHVIPIKIPLQIRNY